KVGDKKVSFAVEGNSVRTFEEITCRERRRCAFPGDLHDRIATAVRDIDIARFSVNRDAYWPPQAAGDEWLRLSLSIHLCDEVAVEVRLQQVSFFVDGVSGSAIKTGGEFVALSFRRNLPNGLSEVRNIYVAEQIDGNPANCVTFNSRRNGANR